MSDDDIDLELHKKKKKIIRTTQESSNDTTMTYYEMLKRLYAMMPEKQQSKVIIPVPNVEPMGSKRTLLVNFVNICKAINRDKLDIQKYIQSELKTETSINIKSHLVCRGRYTSAMFQTVLRSYIKTWVECQACHSLHTSCIRDRNTSLYIMECNSCHATRTITKM